MYDIFSLSDDDCFIPKESNLHDSPYAGSPLDFEVQNAFGMDLSSSFPDHDILDTGIYGPNDLPTTNPTPPEVARIPVPFHSQP